MDLIGRSCFAVTFMLLVASPFLQAFPDGPFPQLTGGFGEGTCLNCHNTSPLNAGHALGGSFSIEGIPDVFLPGQVYPVKVKIAQPGQQRWGFELSSRFAGSGEQAGLLTPTDDLTQVRPAGGIQFIQHTEAGSQAGVANGPVEYAFEWTAPGSASEPVLFNAAGNAANGDNNTTGDYVYTTGAFARAEGVEPTMPVQASVQSEQPKRIFNDSRVAHLPAPTNLDRGDFEFLIQHRFLGSVTEGADLIGLDFGANINLEMTYALSDRLSVLVSRERFDRNVVLGGAVELFTRPTDPVKFSFRGGVQGRNNFRDHYSPFFEFPVQFDKGPFRAYVVPLVVFNSRPDELAEAFRDLTVSPDDNHTFSVGLGTDIALNRKVSFVGEYVPRVAGWGGVLGEKAVISGGFKLRTWGHVFHLMLGNSQSMTPGGYGVNAGSNQVRFGFNIYRRLK